MNQLPVSTAVFALNLAVYGLVTRACGAATPSLPAYVCAAAALALFRHDLVLRWRRPSVLVFGCALCSLLAAVSTHLSYLWLDSAEGGQWAPIAVWILPWPAHAIIWIGCKLLPRKALALPPRGAWSAQARLALARTPCPWRTARPGEGAPVGALPSGCLARLDAHLITPGRPVPLHPEGPAEGMGRAVKTALDLLLIGLFGPVALTVILLLVPVLWWRQGRPLFYRQTRVSLGSKPFFISKLRTMTLDAEASGEPVWPLDNDPRITPVGRLLRRYWMDELPQLWDVLRGPLSLVGPRPERPFFVQEFARRLPNYHLRHQVKAGITGLAQVTGFVGDTAIDRRLHADLRYLRRWTPLNDLKILVGTVSKAARRPPISSK